ncbi:MAG: hypothetical protein NTX03_07310 [Bacteroidetes bacterium]|nr:hypothetical protein [Bacteroidota bacterium]
MEGKNSKIELDDVAMDILSAVYFVEPFDKILEDVNHPAKVVADSLKFLIMHRYITAMKLNEGEDVYVRSFIYDADDMRAYNYVATRKGLLAHNSR